MKILFAVHQFFPHHYTGTERVVLNLCRQLQRMGHDVIVLTYAIDSAEGLYPRGAFLVGKYSFQGIPVIAVRHRELPEDLDFIFRDEGMQALLESIIEDERVDIIHVCHPMRVGSIIPAAISRSLPVVVTLTDFWLLCPKFIAVTRGGIPCDGHGEGNVAPWSVMNRHGNTGFGKGCRRSIGSKTRYRRSSHRPNFSKGSLRATGTDRCIVYRSASITRTSVSRRRSITMIRQLFLAT